jgi:hypothetical protein
MRTDAARLSCPGCRLAYNPAAVARVQALVAGAACPRCGERLQWEHDDAHAGAHQEADGRRKPVSRLERAPRATTMEVETGAQRLRGWK